MQHYISVTCFRDMLKDLAGLAFWKDIASQGLQLETQKAEVAKKCKIFSLDFMPY